MHRCQLGACATQDHRPQNPYKKWLPPATPPDIVKLEAWDGNPSEARGDFKRGF